MYGDNVRSFQRGAFFICHFSARCLPLVSCAMPLKGNVSKQNNSIVHIFVIVFS